jgi:hypothetical protein
MPRSASPADPHCCTGRRIQTRRSGVHGKGVFAVQDIAEGEVLVEYTGESSAGRRRRTATRTTPCNPTTRFTSMWMKTA